MGVPLQEVQSEHSYSRLFLADEYRQIAQSDHAFPLRGVAFGKDGGFGDDCSLSLGDQVTQPAQGAARADYIVHQDHILGP